jgi:hypothetical protein
LSLRAFLCADGGHGAPGDDAEAIGHLFFIVAAIMMLAVRRGFVNDSNDTGRFRGGGSTMTMTSSCRWPGPGRHLSAT